MECNGEEKEWVRVGQSTQRRSCITLLSMRASYTPSISLSCSTQNAAIHVFCRLIAEQLNDAGYEMVVQSAVLKKEVEVPWTQDSVKDFIWRKVQTSLYAEKQSTVKLERKEVSEVAEVITRYLGEKFNLQVSFPSRGEI